MKAIGLFSGGKDSLYSIYLAEEKGLKIKDLICLLPNLPFPNPHGENFEAIKILANSMKKNLTIVDMKKGKKEFIEVLKRLNGDFLVAGDVNVEQHVLYLESICSKVGLKLFEPLFGKNTLDLFNQIFGLGFRSVIAGVDLRVMDEKWLGFEISSKSAEAFLLGIKGLDPLGENGEFHTITLRCPLYSEVFEVKSYKKKIKGDFAYLVLSLV